MFKFLSEAFSELSHVSWPTQKDMSRYMTVNVVLIVVGTLFILGLSTFFSFGLQALRSSVSVGTPTTATPLNDLLGSGAVVDGSGATTTETPTEVSASGTAQ